MEFVTLPFPTPIKVSSGPLGGLGLSLLSEMKPNELRDLSVPSPLRTPGRQMSGPLFPPPTGRHAGNSACWEYLHLGNRCMQQSNAFPPQRAGGYIFSERRPGHGI